MGGGSVGNSDLSRPLRSERLPEGGYGLGSGSRTGAASAPGSRTGAAPAPAGGTNTTGTGTVPAGGTGTAPGLILAPMSPNRVNTHLG